MNIESYVFESETEEEEELRRETLRPYSLRVSRKFTNKVAKLAKSYELNASQVVRLGIEYLPKKGELELEDRIIQKMQADLRNAVNSLDGEEAETILTVHDTLTLLLHKKRLNIRTMNI